jgi:hypothetical protein
MFVFRIMLVTYPVSPSFARLMHKGLRNARYMPAKFIVSCWIAIVPQSFMEESITKAGCMYTVRICILKRERERERRTGMRQQHPQSNPVRLLNQLSILLQNLDIFQLRHQPLNLIRIIQTKHFLLNKLHARYPRYQLGARKNGKDRVECHGLIACNASFAACMRKSLAILVDCYKHSAGNAGFVGDIT